LKTSFQNRIENKFYIGIIITSVILLGVFFTSKLWMYDDNPVMQTPFNSNINGLDQTTLRLNSWEYNPNKELMEVVLETDHSGSDLIKPNFTFSARERNDTDEFPVRVVYEDDTNIIVQIRNIPDNYQVIGLIVQEHRDTKILESEMENQPSATNTSVDQDTTDEEITIPEPAEQIIVGDYRKIKVNSELVTRDAFDYQIENVKREIEEIEQQITAIDDEQIPLQNEIMEVLNDEIESIEMDLEYQTDDEQEGSMREIESRENRINDAEKTIEDLELEIENLTEQHQNLHKRLDTIQDEKNENDAAETDKDEEQEYEKKEGDKGDEKEKSD